jgi:hypothetical protein
VLQRAGDPDQAVFLLESTIDAYAETETHLPGWLCGRLATLYRTLERHDDEVRLLERYSESQSADDVRTRFDARLSKARAIAERKRRTETRALTSVRRVLDGRGEKEEPIIPITQPADESFSPETVRALRAAVAGADADAPEPTAFVEAIYRLCQEAHERGYPPERVVIALKSVWDRTDRPAGVTKTRWEALYRSVLTRALGVYFGDSHE